MDAGIIDTINRQDARKIAQYLDKMDTWVRHSNTPWYRTLIADTAGGADSRKASKVLVLLAAECIASGVVLHFDGNPAGDDWENLLNNFRAEIEARRGSETPRASAQSVSTVV